MRTSNLIKALRALMVETGSLACMGCGYEHGCGMRGCAIIREAADALERLNDFDQTQSARLLQKLTALEKKRQWLKPEEVTPPEDETVLVFVDGRPLENVEMVSALMTATWYGAEGWVLEEFPEAENGFRVTYWMPLPDAPEEVENQ